MSSVVTCISRMLAQQAGGQAQIATFRNSEVILAMLANLDVVEDVVAAVDCGYGSVKATVNTRNGIIAFPSGACPADQALGDLDAGQASEPIMIDDEAWVAGFESASLPAYQRPIHRTFATTDHYQALLMEAVYRLGERHIALLVLGLPTDLYLNDRAQLDHLKGFAGRHQIHGRTVVIHDVVVCNQPMGSTTAFARRRGRIAVIDVGYRTTDTTLLVNGGIDPSGYSTCQTASRDVCDAVARHFEASTGISVSADMIDQAFRLGAMTIERRLKTYDLREHLDAVAPQLTETIWAAVQTTLRQSVTLLDQILLTGGGAYLLRKYLEPLVSPVPVTVPNEPAKANVEGYLQLGAALVQQRKQAHA